MTNYEYVQVAFWLIVLAPLLVIIAYAIGRAVAFAHFKTKLEYLRTMMKELKGGPDV